MADFHQNGNITTLHNLRTRGVEELNYELSAFAQTRKISLILPSLFSELEGEALPHIVDELGKVPYLHRIVIGLDRATEAQFRQARAFFSSLPQDHIVIWNDSPRMLEMQARLENLGLAPQEPGKGKNVWSCIGYLIGCADSAVMAIHDCDILTYENEMLARLVYPVANPTFPYQVAKGKLIEQIAQAFIFRRVGIVPGALSRGKRCQTPRACGKDLDPFLRSRGNGIRRCAGQKAEAENHQGKRVGNACHGISLPQKP